MSKPELVKLIDTTLCTACRGCQVACKQWNELPGLKTKQLGTYQNPPDLQWNTWTLIRFQEYEDKNKNFQWIFRKDGCMHCTDAACVKVCPSGSLYYTPLKTVGIHRDKCIGCRNACRPARSTFPSMTQKPTRFTNVTCAIPASAKATRRPA